MSYQIVTVSNRVPQEEYYTFREFFESLRRYMAMPVILGQGLGEYKGLGSKPKLLRKAILNKRLITATHLIFTDSWDVVFAGSPNKIMEKYKEFNSPFVCSSERNCFPGDLKDQFPEATTSYRFLNSGFIVAETEAMLTVLESMDLDNVPDDYYDKENNRMVHINDQFLFQQEFIRQPVKMVLDYKQELSQTLHQVKLEDLDFSKDKIHNVETGSTPLSFHFNGSGKTDGLREPILEKLGL